MSKIEADTLHDKDLLTEDSYLVHELVHSVGEYPTANQDTEWYFTPPRL